MYKEVIDPTNNKRYSVNSARGISVIKNYIYQIGGGGWGDKIKEYLGKAGEKVKEVATSTLERMQNAADRVSQLMLPNESSLVEDSRDARDRAKSGFTGQFK